MKSLHTITYGKDVLSIVVKEYEQAPTIFDCFINGVEVNQHDPHIKEIFRDLFASFTLNYPNV